MNVFITLLGLFIFYFFVILVMCTFLYNYPNVLSTFVFGPFVKLPTSYDPAHFDISASNYSIDNGKICIWDFYKDSDKIVLYIHGIFSDRTYITRRELCVNLWNNNYHVVSYDSNGYGESIKHNLTEDGLVESCITLYLYLKNKYNKEIIFWSHSLGTGVALKSITKLKELNYNISYTVLEAPFYDLMTAVDKFPITNYLLYGKHMLKRKLKKINLSFLNYYYINQNNTKFLLLHARNDTTIPYYNSIKLAFECNNCKLILFKKGDHAYLYKNKKIYEYFTKFINGYAI
jgi:pimeloyl-ACP methyl ester carboxylesterase